MDNRQTQITDPTTHATREALVVLEAVSKSFREGEKTRMVLDRVTARIHAGEIVALVGRSGSGKSTLLNLICGIEAPDQGGILVEGRRLDTLGERDRTLYRRARVGFIYQFFNLIPTLTVAENVALPLELNGVPAGERVGRVMALLQAVDLADRGDAFPDRLSGGEQQRVAIARALAHEPPLLLADEPTGNLDAETGARVMALLHGLVREQGRALVLVTHSPEVSAMADHVWELMDGRLRPWGAS
ncbi:ABC transporter ATP-binding protein [Ectothiorhodospira shaposhnikovii]|uniref:ABC transporter ATP-binding protein n=1 Tax=Ectothiorhodospira shaposhnikovii TaxID=1054 RepID=UPI001902F25C|nr:ABC transporter ATP-binding protein [Ectothiorhodospira shaposhnikovii]MBK1673063.1 ABC transporter ATP-binding protein [Ectothiorhodospira shaposhnikovii]